MNNQNEEINKAQKVINGIIEMCQEIGDERKAQTLNKALDILKSINTENDDMSDILCSAADICRQLKVHTALYQQSFSVNQIEDPNYASACLFSKLSGELHKHIKAAENLV